MTAAALSELAPTLWLGPYVHEAVSAYHRARASGLSPLRALVAGQVASFKDAWVFRRTMAGKVGCSVRTVGRALEQARREGLIGVARAKKGELPRDRDGRPVQIGACGFSHRWTIGWGKAGEAVKECIARARAKFLARAIVKGKEASVIVQRSRQPARRWTAEALDAELVRRARLLAGEPPESVDEVRRPMEPPEPEAPPRD